MTKISITPINANIIPQLLFDGKKFELNSEIITRCQKLYTSASQIRESLDMRDKKYIYFASLRSGATPDKLNELARAADIRPSINSLIQQMFAMKAFKGLLKVFISQRLADYYVNKSDKECRKLQKSFEENYALIRKDLGLDQDETYEYGSGIYNILLERYELS